MFKSPEASEEQEAQFNLRGESLARRFRPEDRAEISAARTAATDHAGGENEWVDKGIVDVPVTQIDLSDSWVKGEQDFKKVSPQEVRRGFQTLEKDVKPAVAKGATGDDFRVLDQNRGQEYANGSQRVYDAFYGNDSIRLEKVGNQYRVINGYHRLFIAKEMGIELVPARVIEKQV
jgi:hypothetical protein